MSIFYTTLKKRTRVSPEKEQYFAFAKMNEDIDLDQIANQLSDGSTTRRSDVYAVLIGLVDIMKKELANGNRVRLGDLGSFSIVVKSKGSPKRLLVNQSNIIGSKLQYRPALGIKKFLRTLEYKKKGRKSN